MNLKPTKLKSIVSIIVIIVIYLLSLYLNKSGCSILGAPGCVMDNSCCNYCQIDFSLYPSCLCSCTTFTELIKQILIFILPGVIIYIIWSIFQKKK